METKRIKSAQVRAIFGDCSTATLYRMWKEYQTLAPPTVIRGINYWTPQEVEQAFQNSQKADTTPTQSTAAQRAATARRGKKTTQGDR